MCLASLIHFIGLPAINFSIDQELIKRTMRTLELGVHHEEFMLLITNLKVALKDNPKLKDNLQI